MNNNDLLHTRRTQAVAKGMASAFPIYVKKAKNAEVWDSDDNRYIDFIGGISVLNTGHAHPKIIKAVQEQAEQFSHTAFNALGYEVYVELAEKLNAAAPGKTPKKTALFSTGAESVENAVKIARAYTGREAVITFVGGFHGRTLLTLGMTGRVDPYKKQFGPFPPSIYRIPYPVPIHGISEADSLQALDNLFKADVEANKVAAIVIEPVQGEGGFYAASKKFFIELRSICDEHGILLVCDEVQTSFGRTGTLFASEQISIEPDMIAAAKSLAGGYPLSAVIGKAEIMDSVNAGGLGGTYGGNAVACAASLAVFNIIQEEGLLERSKLIGKHLVNAIQAIKDQQGETTIIGDIRTKGAMFAFEFVNPDGMPDANMPKKLVAKCFEKGLLLLTCGVYGNAVRVMVPLTVSDAILDEGIAIIKSALDELVID